MATFLIISPEPWVAHTVSKHHYALTLAAKGHEVLFLNPPASSGKLNISHSAQTSGVRVVDAPSVAAGLRYLPAAARRTLEARWLQRLETHAQVRIDAVWLFENSRFYDMGFAGRRLKIYHQVDLNQNFHPHVAARSADVCLCTTDAIRNQLLRSAERVHKIHHGTPAAGSHRLTEAQGRLFLRGCVNAAYVGNLAMEYLDAELLLATARAHPQVRFHLIGAYSEASLLHREGRGLPNLVWWGKQPSALIPALLREVDVVLCTYRASRYRDQLASPHKFMEYFASGKTIVATYTDEYKDKRDLLCMVDGAEDYVRAFGKVVADLASYNSSARCAQRRAFAADHSYDLQLARIARIVRDAVPQHASLFEAAEHDRQPERVS